MRKFITQTLASMLGSLLGFTLFFGIGTVGLISLIITAASRDTGPQVKDKSILVFDLSLTVRDTDPTSSTSRAIEEALSGEETDTITLRTVVDSLNAAAEDSRIVALYLDGSQTSTSSGTGFATLKEVREALERFKESGKKIIAYDVDSGEGEYYLSSIADTMILNPMGSLEMNGFSSQPMFFTGALEKFGIGIQVIRVGKYKSAVEPFVLTELSPENRQQMQALLEDLWTEFRTTVGKSRQVTPQQLQAIADTQGIVLASDAIGRRLVDKVGYYDEVITQLQELTGESETEKSFRQVHLSTYADIADKPEHQRASKNKIAVLYASGEIVDGEGSVQEVGGESFAAQMRKLRLDDSVKAVVLRVNSPGGSATASEIIQREVKLTRDSKPVIISMGDIAASGGYWISTYGNRIFAEPNTVTGSIGVFGLLMNVQQIANENGITWDVVKTGRFADTQTVSRPKTPQELALIQNIVNQVYSKFLDKVAESRKLPKDKVAQIAQGRVWSGIDAKQLGLVDEIGGLDDAIEYAVKEANLGEDWKLEEYPRFQTLEERLIQEFVGNDSNKTQQTDPLMAEFMKLKEDLAMLQALNDPKGIYARLPFNWRFD
ncbi:MAG: signal peptide peptidase SppA [Coleofasciculus chthonoplastes F3-SA18-01]|uniref:signal peptide peptidase SppA n=1 Tax=Coleofasciculus chthonoplastes TaxID=64178 RepID=UPI0032F1E49C